PTAVRPAEHRRTTTSGPRTTEPPRTTRPRPRTATHREPTAVQGAERPEATAYDGPTTGCAGSRPWRVEGRGPAVVWWVGRQGAAGPGLRLGERAGAGPRTAGCRGNGRRRVAAGARSPCRRGSGPRRRGPACGGRRRPGRPRSGPAGRG